MNLLVCVVALGCGGSFLAHSYSNSGVEPNVAVAAVGKCAAVAVGETSAVAQTVVAAVAEQLARSFHLLQYGPLEYQC